jgi:hypothetical protein
MNPVNGEITKNGVTVITVFFVITVISLFKKRWGKFEISKQEICVKRSSSVVSAFRERKNKWMLQGQSRHCPCN